MHYYTKHIKDYKTDTAHLTLLEHGVYNSLIDLYILISEFGETFNMDTLRTAIQNTFAHRKTDLPELPVKVFTAYFYEDSGKLTQWNAFINKTTDKDLSLQEACEIIKTDVIAPKIKIIDDIVSTSKT